jgi:hypothetical protein
MGNKEIIEEYKGLDLQVAYDLAAEQGKIVRAVEIDGEPQIVTMDFCPGRLNLSVCNGVVCSVEVEGCCFSADSQENLTVDQMVEFQDMINKESEEIDKAIEDGAFETVEDLDDI